MVEVLICLKLLDSNKDADYNDKLVVSALCSWQHSVASIKLFEISSGDTICNICRPTTVVSIVTVKGNLG